MSSVRSLLSWLVYVPLQIAFVPSALVGVAIAGYKQVVVSRRLGVSATAIEVIGGRWTMHAFGLRDDEPTNRLIHALPNASTFGLWLVLLPLWIKYRVSGTHFLYPRVPREGEETLADLMVVRTLHFDRILERSAPDVEQFVLLGAGYDTRAYGRLNRDGIRFFELDQAQTQTLKIASIDRSGIDRSHVTFVVVDFGTENAFEKLREAGYDPTKKTLFLWEGVTLYLSEEDVLRALDDVRQHAPPGSALVADIYARRFVDYASKSLNKKALEYTSEAVTFGLPFENDHEGELARFLAPAGLRLGESHFLGTRNAKGPYAVVAELVV